MTAAKMLFLLGVVFIVGVAFASFVTLPQLLLWAFLLAAFALVIGSFFVKKIPAATGFLMLFFLLGIVRFQVANAIEQQDYLRNLIGTGTVTVQGTVVEEPDVRPTEQKLTVQVGKSLTLVTIDPETQYRYLDDVKLTGKVTAPKVYDDFNYQDYLKKDYIYSVMDYPAVQITGTEKPNATEWFYQWIISARLNIQSQIAGTFAPPASSLWEGIILGQNNQISQAVSQLLNNTGTRFLTAISGVHVIIISNLLLAVFLAAGLWRRQAITLSIAFIFLYIALTGFTASGIRAGIMGSLLLLAQFFGRQYTGGRIIALAAAFMLLENPFLLRYDSGFQLSFAASLGIIYAKPLVDFLLKHFFTEGSRLKDIISVTLVAQLFSLPIMLFSFGSVSVVSPFTNLLIIPVFYWMLIFGLLFSVAGLFSHGLALLFAAPCWLLMKYFIGVLQFFNPSWSAFQTTGVSWWLPLACYLTLGFLTWFFQKKFIHRF